MKRLLLCCLGLWCGPLALAQGEVSAAPIDNTAAHQRIEAARAQAMAGFTAEDAECYKRFAVSGCLKQVQSRRRSVLADLRGQEAVLHEAELAQQAAEQRKRVAQRAQERQQQDADLQADDGPGRAADKLKEQQEKQVAHAAKATVPATGTATPSAATGPTLSEQARMRDAYARKLQDAEKKRRDMARLQAGKTTKPAAPLPLPLPQQP